MKKLIFLFLSASLLSLSVSAQEQNLCQTYAAKEFLQSSLVDPEKDTLSDLEKGMVQTAMQFMYPEKALDPVAAFEEFKENDGVIRYFKIPYHEKIRTIARVVNYAGDNEGGILLEVYKGYISFMGTVSDGNIKCLSWAG